jgi:outer membrane lipoprotein-sorting protein
MIMGGSRASRGHGSHSISNSKLRPCNFELIGFGEARLALPHEMLCISSATSVSRIPIPNRINTDSIWSWNQANPSLERFTFSKLNCSKPISFCRALYWLLIVFWCAISLAAQDGEAILAKTDRFRHPWPSFSVDITIFDGTSEQRWQVIARENGDAVVRGQSEKEKGRIVYCLGEKMWLVVPGSKRPHQVMPQHRLLGPAAGGDIAKARLRDAYSIRAVAPDVLENRGCYKLHLEAQKKSESYKKIDLWVDGEDGAPIVARYYLGSGKLARTVKFGQVADSRGVRVLASMSIVDIKGKEIQMIFQSWRPINTDPSDFELPSFAKDAKNR